MRAASRPLDATHLTGDVLRTPPVYEALLEADVRRRGLGGGAAPGGGGRAKEPRSVVVGIQRDSALQGKPLREAGLPGGCLVVSVERGGRELLPHAGLVLVPGDHIAVLTPADEPEAALAVVELARAR